MPRRRQKCRLGSLSRSSTAPTAAPLASPAISPKFEIKGDDDARIRCRPLKYLAVRHIAETQLADIDGFVTRRPQPVRHRRRKVHIEKKTHLGNSNRDDL